ncbi:MAG: phosphotransferase [Planctomycetota bacterium]|jgi:homoserine kinase type II
MNMEREKFGADELAVCLSHYDLGTIKSIKEFARGSRRSPKAVVDSKRGTLLFKRRAVGKDNIRKVAFAHQIQLHLAAQNFPLPHLIGTRENNNSMLVKDNLIYELFEYIPGENYDGSGHATHSAGHILGLYHKLMREFKGDYNPPTGSYHNAKAIHQAVKNAVASLPKETLPPAETLGEVVGSLEAAYQSCAKRANELGLTDWERQIVHGDWHPGNMLFGEDQVVAVIDYDSARLQQRVIDLANGALQFSIIGGEEPAKWPDHMDEVRFQKFLSGYDSVNVISKAEIKVIPFLMCEAMIAEAVLPIAATGSFGQFEGFPFLQMIDRKVKWILSHVKRLQGALQQQ